MRFFSGFFFFQHGGDDSSIACMHFFLKKPQEGDCAKISLSSVEAPERFAAGHLQSALGVTLVFK